MQRMIQTLMNSWAYEPTLFDDLVLPEHVDTEQFLSRLMVKCGEMEVHITRPAILKQAIGFWSKSRKPIWDRFSAVQDFEYNPIWNVDGTVVHSGTAEDQRTYGRGRSESGTETGTETSTTTGTLAADNSESWSNDTKTDYTASNTRDNSVSETINDTEEQQRSDDWTDRRTGNIGVTTTQKMLTEEMEFWQNYDLYDIIIKEFKQEFCIMLY